MANDSREVVGYCPMGCGKTLFLGAGGHVTCSFIRCPKPDAASDILNVAETNHIAVFSESDWTLEHPLRDRIEGHLFDCPAHRACRELDGPPVVPGRYRMIRMDGVGMTEPLWHWEKA